MSTDRHVTALAIIPKSVDEVRSLSAIYAKSSLLPPDLRGKEADVFVTVMAGLELGLSPMAALRLIHVVKGRPILSADGMVAVAQASGLCEYFRCICSNASKATYETKRKGAPEIQSLTFTIEEAQQAGLLANDNWRRYPAAMLRARAKAALARDVYPDALAGVYTDDEADDLELGGTQAQLSDLLPDVIDAEVDEGPQGSAESLEERIKSASSMEDLKRLHDELRRADESARARLRSIYRVRRDALLASGGEAGGGAP